MTKRILALEANKGQGVVYSHAQPTPFGKEVGNGGISSLNSQKAMITPMAHNAMAPYGEKSPAQYPAQQWEFTMALRLVLARF